MIKLFMTGDNHFGKKFGRFPEVRDKLIESRFQALSDMVKKAEEEGCEIFVITGDLFDSINTIKVSDVTRVAEILAAFTGNVIIIPGNHDYYTGEEKVWQHFENALLKVSHNITLTKEFKPYYFETGEETVVIYPAFCTSKHSAENNLKWIKECDIRNENTINIGVAHGAIKGITPDMKEEYFLMTEEELLNIPVDAWLVGHTHIAYPNVLLEDEDTKGYKIFNAGTHEQLDLHNNTEGNGFILTIDKNDGICQVMARKFKSGKIRYFDMDINVSADSENSLHDSIARAISSLDRNSIVRIKVSGTCKSGEYEEKEAIYKMLLKDFITYEKYDDQLSEEITVDTIRSEFAETSFAAKFMEELIDNPIELQMTYKLIQECRD